MNLGFRFTRKPFCFFCKVYVIIEDIMIDKLQAIYWQQRFPSPWPAIWAWIFMAIIVLGIFMPNSTIITVIKLSGILLCLLYAYQSFPEDRLLQLALLCTFIADTILAINNIADGGLIFFLAAQLIHLYRLEPQRRRPIAIIFAIISVIAIASDLIFKFAPLIYVICAFYLQTIIMNIIVSWRWHRHHPKEPLSLYSLIGFGLFLACDICVGISYLSLTGTFSPILYMPANFFAWFFYYPSQILVSNSSRYAKMVPKGR